MKRIGLVTGAAALNPIYDAHKYMTKVGEEPNGVLYNVDAEGTTLKVLHVFGSPYERGFAQGVLIGDDLMHFGWEDLDDYFGSQVEGLTKYLDKLPDWLQKWLEKTVVDPLAKLAVGAFPLALEWVFDV